LHGGAALSLLYTARGMREKGYVATIGLIEECEVTTMFYESSGFEVIQLPRILRIFYWSASEQPWTKLHTYLNVGRYLTHWTASTASTREFFLQNKFDVVHLNSVVLLNTAKVLRGMGIPYVWHIREYGPSKQGFRWNIFRREMLAAKAVIFLSKAEQLSWTGGNKCGVVIANFVDLEKFNPASKYEDIRLKHSIQSDELLLLFVGGLRQHKGAGTLIQCVHWLKKTGCKVKCIMPGGEDPEGLINNSFAKRIIALELSDRFIFEEFNPDLRAHYASCDVLVFPASVPHFARPVIEASAMGKPCVGTDIPPINELILEGETGLLFKKVDYKGMAAVILKLANDKNLREQMGSKGRKLAHRLYNLDAQVDKIEQVYLKLWKFHEECKQEL